NITFVSMNVCAYILSIYLLGLTLAPCGDSTSIHDLNQDPVAVQLDSSHGHGHSGDQCSPFCQCHCCHVHVVHFNSDPNQIIIPQTSSLQSPHFDRHTLDITLSILQPPKV